MKKAIILLFILLILIQLANADTLFSDDFESGTLNGWNLSNIAGASNWTNTNTNPYQGTQHAQSRPLSTTEPASILERLISTSGYQNISFRYYRKLVGLDVADEFQAEWFNGTVWQILEQTGGSSANDATYLYREYNLSSSAENNPDLKIKFECTAGATSEYCRVDNVNITGILASSDTIPPFFTSIPNPVNIIYGQGFNVDFDAADEINFGSFFINWTTHFSINQSGLLKNITWIAAGNYNINVSINDSSGNKNSTIYQIAVNKSGSITSLIISPTSPITYGIANNFSCSNSAGLNSLLYINGIDKSSQNSLNITRAAGNYVISCNSSDNQNYTSSSQQESYIITKAYPILTKRLNGIESNLSIIYPQPINASGSVNGGSLAIYLNGTEINNGWNQSLAAGHYRFDFNVTGDQNYTNAYGVLFGEINKSSQTAVLEINESLPIIYGTLINVSCNGELYRNNINITNEKGVEKLLGAGNYNYSCKLYESQNYIYDDDNLTFSINKANPVLELYINGTADNQTAHFSVKTNVSFVLNNFEQQTTLYKNGIENNSNLNIYQELEIGNYNFTLIAGETQNYTAISITRWSHILCLEYLQNTSWTEWADLGNCKIDDLQEQIRNKTQYDSNGCGYFNTTFHEYRNISCDYCTPSAVNTSWTEWKNDSLCSISDNQQQNRSKEQYDANNCHAITGLESDEFINETFWEYYNISCNYCSYNISNTTLSEWENISCLISDLMNQSRYKTEYDSNYKICYAITGLESDLWNSGENTTYWEYRNIESCDYCISNLINTTLSEWYFVEECQTNNTRIRQRNWTEYDGNNCNEIENTTYFENEITICDYCAPNPVNTTWSEWHNLGECLINNTQIQIRNLTEYDSNNCGEIANKTIYDYQITVCDYCIPNLVNTTKTNWQNQGICLINDTQLQNRSWTEFDSNNCGETENITYWEYQNANCDYCVPNRINTTWSEWYFIKECGIDDLRKKQRNMTEYDENTCYYITGLESDLSENTTHFENGSEICDYLTMYCEIGGPYQQGALVLFIGNVSNETSMLVRKNISMKVYKNEEIILSKLLESSQDGDFETTFSNLSIGNYRADASVSHLGANETCSKTFQIGSAASLVLNKIANVYNISEKEIFYNISLRVLNKGGSNCINISLTDADYLNSPFNIEILPPGENLLVSYLKNFTRQNTTIFYSLVIAEAKGFDSYSNEIIFSNSSSMDLTIPAKSSGKQVVITKNIAFIEETSLNISYNVSSILYNTGDENLENIIYSDSDIYPGSILLNLSKGESALFSNLVIVDKAASNIEHEFALGTLIIGILSFYSNQPVISIPGYGGPADLIVHAPASVAVSTLFSSIIEIKNINPDIGQDFILDYWITNIDEISNYSAGQQTLYTAANSSINATVALISPNTEGDYKLKANVAWAAGKAISFNTFKAISESTQETAPSSGNNGGSAANTPKKSSKNESRREPEPAKEVTCNHPYIKYQEECCLDNNNNSLCDNNEKPEIEQPKQPQNIRLSITGLIINNITDIRIIGMLFLLLINLLIIILVILLILRLLKERKIKPDTTRLKNTLGLKVYTSEGIEIGKLEEIYIKNNKIDSLKIKLSKKKKFKLKGIIISYKYIESIKEIIIINERILEKIQNV